VIFTADPTTGAPVRMIIESVFGQGAAIVSGRVEPDTYILDKVGSRLISVRQGRQKFKIARSPDGADIEQPLDAGEVDRASARLKSSRLLNWVLRAERHTPQDLDGHGRGSNISGPVASDHHSEGSGGIRAATDGFGYPDSYSLAWRHLQGARQGGYGRRLAAQRGAMA
jgi:Pyruvate phosphate dikinase, AMP/ATP-binding domain